MTMSSDLAAELTNAAIAAWPKIRGELQGAGTELAGVDGEAAEKFKTAQGRIAEYLRDGMTGKISRAIAETAVSRELDGLKHLFGGLKEAAAHRSVARAKKILIIAGQVALALLRAAV